MTRPAIAVIVPARNAAATIGRTLAALSAQTLDDDAYEVIVVDSGSSDGTPALVAATDASTVLVRNPGGEPSSSRNLGARHASAPRFAFTDADCEPEPGWLEAGLQALNRADLVQGRVIPAGRAGRYDRTVSVGAEYGLYETASLFVSREAFVRAGGFEPVPGVALTPDDAPFGEDAWFGWRCRRDGARTAFEPRAAVRHAVFPRKRRDFITERARAGHFPALVRAIPELRATFLHHRTFLSLDSFRFDLALAGLALAAATRRRAPLTLALPYLAAGPTPATLAADALTCASLAAGTIKTRTPVL